MIWYTAEDIYYYELCRDLNKRKNGTCLNKYTENENYTELSGYKKIIISPTSKQIRKNIGKDNIAFLSPVEPPDKYSNVFVEVELENLHGALTTQELKNNISISQSLENKLALKTVMPDLTFDDLAGAYGFKEWAKTVDLFREKGNAIKPVLLVGVPGVGKSYLAACYAGEKKIPLMMLDLSVIKNSTNPSKLLHKVFHYLSEMEQEVVLLIDELEQAIHGKNTDILGTILSIFNDLNTSVGYTFKGILFATSNNISDLIQNTPQFIRHGRWNDKFFVNYPTRQEALEVMKLYRNKNKLPEDVFNHTYMTMMYSISAEHYIDVNIDEERSVYSNSEIAYLFEKIALYYNDSYRADKLIDLVETQISAVSPLQETAHVALQTLIKDAQRNKFTKV